MKRMMFTLLIATMVGSSSGCCMLDRLFCRPCGGGLGHGGHAHGAGGCSTCGPVLGHKGGGLHGGGGGGEDMYAGQGMGATAYPYYTTRGPRDFLAKNPRSIGP